MLRAWVVNYDCVAPRLDEVDVDKDVSLISFKLFAVPVRNASKGSATNDGVARVFSRRKFPSHQARGERITDLETVVLARVL